MTLFLVGLCAVLAVVTLVVAVGCLSAVGHLHKKMGSIETGVRNLSGLTFDQHVESLEEVRFQARVTRKASNEALAKVFEALGTPVPKLDWVQAEFERIVNSDEFKNPTSGCLTKDHMGA